MTTTAADSQAIKEHVAKDHTRQCAEHMVLEKGQCECEVENFELRDPAELLDCINRLTSGAL